MFIITNGIDAIANLTFDALRTSWENISMADANIRVLSPAVVAPMTIMHML